MRSLALLLILLGCGSTGGTPRPADEDPEVLAHIKAKGWRLGRDIRISDGKWVTFLTVQLKDKPFEDFEITPDDYKMIARSKTAQVLDLRNVKATDDGLKAVAALPNVEAVILKGDDLTDAALKHVAGWKSLDNVTVLGGKKLTDAGVKELAALPKLKSLYLGFVTLDGSGFSAFAGAKTLTSLTLDFVDGFTDDGARHVAKIPNLDELKIRSGFGDKKPLTAAGVRAIVEARLPAKFEFDKKLMDDDLFISLVKKGWLYGPTPPGQRKRPATAADLREIVIDDSRVTDKGVAAVLDCVNVTSLHARKSGITDESLKKMGAFKKLSYLSLGKTKVTAAGLEAVLAAPLRHVAMEGCDLTEDMFKAFAKMQNLEELWLHDTKPQSDWFRHLAGLPKLKDLNLPSTGIDDTAVKQIAAASKLEKVNIQYTDVTDEGFRLLVALPQLRSLYFDGTKVTKEAYLKAKKDKPKLYLQNVRLDR